MANAASPPMTPTKEVVRCDEIMRLATETGVRKGGWTYRQRWHQPECGESVVGSLSSFFRCRSEAQSNDITHTCICISCSLIPLAIILYRGDLEMTWTGLNKHTHPNP